MTQELVLLGTGTSVGIPIVGCRCNICTSDNPKNNRTRSGVYITTPNGNFLIDTSPELRIQLIRENVEKVHAAIFTHAHADHIFGLDDLRIFGFRLNQEIELFCEPNVEQQLRESFSYAFVDPATLSHHFAIPRLSFESISTEPFEVLGQEIIPIRLFHGKLPVLGFRINNVAFCTDVSFIPDESWPLLEGLDILILDALRNHPHPTHFSVKQALEVVDKVQPKKAYFTHISHSLEHEETNATLPEHVNLAYDGLRIPY